MHPDDAEELLANIREITSGVRAALDDELSLEQMLENLTFEQYNDWRGYERRERNLTAIFEKLTTGEATFFVPARRAEPTGNQ